MSTTDVPPHRYPGARAMILLHDRHMREFLATWRRAKAASLKLPETSDDCYASLEHLLAHLLGAARGYMLWMCEKLGLAAPDMPADRCTHESIADLAAADAYLEHVLRGWCTPLRDIDEDRFGEVYKSRWNIDYCIDSMMEHAVLHPIRHTFQLDNLLAAR